MGFISTSPDSPNIDNLNEGKNNKNGTIFSLGGNIWGYNITLFNYYNRKEILIEPESKFIIEEIIPSINEIIYIKCNLENNPNQIILNDIINNYSIKRYFSNSKSFDYLLKYILIGDSNVGKSDFLLTFANNEIIPDNQITIGVEFGAKNFEIRNKIYRIQIWDTSGQENYSQLLELIIKIQYVLLLFMI